MVPLPQKWDNFITLSENKVDLAKFLCEQQLLRAPTNKVLIASGGFIEEDHVECSVDSVNITGLKALHEEADTRLVLHSIHPMLKMSLCGLETLMFLYYCWHTCRR